MSKGRNEARIMEKEEGKDKERREKVWKIIMQSGGGMGKLRENIGDNRSNDEICR